MPEYKYRISADTNSAQQATQQLADKTASLDDLMVKGEKAANEYAAAAGATAKQIGAFGKANELTAGEVKKLIEAGSLAKEEVGKLGQAELEAAKQTKSLKDSSAEAAKSLGDMATGMQAAIAALGIERIAQGTAELYNLGAANERIAASTDKLTGGRADEYIQRLSAATHGLVDDDYLLVQANEALRTGVSQSADELGKLDEIAIAMGRDLGVGAADAVGIMTQALSAASPKQLEQLGILVKQSDLTAEVNKLLSENAGMSQSAAQQQALLNLVLKTGNDYLAKTGGLQDDAASESERFAVELGNVKDAGAEMVVAYLQPAIHSLNMLVDISKTVREHNLGISESNAQVANSFEEFVQKEHDAGFVTDYLNDKIQNGEKLGYREQAAVDALRKAWEGYTNTVVPAAQATEEAVQPVEDLAKAQKDAEQAAQQYLQTMRDQQTELNNLIGLSTSATESISHLGVEGWQANAESGAAFLDFLRATKNDLLLTGQALIDFQVKQGILNESQAAFVHNQQVVADFLALYPGQINAAAAAFEQFAVGNDNAAASILNAASDAEQAGRTYSGTGDAIRNTNQAIAESKDPIEQASAVLANANQSLEDLGINAGPAFEAITTAAKPAYDIASQLNSKIANINSRMVDITGTAETAFADMQESAGKTNPVLAIANTQAAGIADSVAYLLGHSNINLNVNVNQNGSLPSSGGGSNFYTSGPMVMLVGDNPGGVERVSVTPLSGRGVTHGLPGGGVAFGGGTEGFNGTSQTGTTPLVMELDGRTIGEMLLPYVLQAANLRGLTLAPMVTTT